MPERVLSTVDGAAAQVLVTARFVAVTGAVLAERSWQVRSVGGTPVRAGELAVDLADVPTDVFLLDLSCVGPDGATRRNRYLLSRTADLAPLLDLPTAALDCTVEPDGGRWQLHLTHTSGPAALGLVLTDDRPYAARGWAVFGDNLIDLLPGESTVVTVDWRDAPADGRAVRLEGWNTGVHHVH